MKKGPFKLKSGNKPSMAQLSGVSPMKEMVDKGASKGKEVKLAISVQLYKI